MWGGGRTRARREAAATLGHAARARPDALVAQVGLGLLLLSDDRRHRDDLHYVYGTLALVVVLAPWFYAPEEPRAPARLVRRNLARRCGARRARVHHVRMKRFWSELNPTLRGFLIIGADRATVVVLNLYTALASLQALARIAFVLAIAFFVFLLWRERREEIAVVAGPCARGLLRRRRS